jgi:hypothetical protein
VPEPEGPRSESASPGGRALDSRAVEVLASTVFRAVFKNGVRVPLQMDGMVDMDVVVKDNNVILNLNAVQAEVPPLAIWRVTFAYRGRPVADYGRGVKNDLKIHYPQLCVLFLAVWRERRRKNKARAQGDAARDRELVTMSAVAPSPRTAGEPPV